MDNSGYIWDNDEDNQLINLYSKYKMDISEIAKIHKRSVLAIQKRLEKHELINTISSCKNSFCENFVWNKVIDIENRMRKNNILFGNKNELICQAVSEAINEKMKELNDKIENVQLNSLD